MLALFRNGLYDLQALARLSLCANQQSDPRLEALGIKLGPRLKIRLTLKLIPSHNYTPTLSLSDIITSVDCGLGSCGG